MEFSSSWPMNPSWKRGIGRLCDRAEWEVRIEAFRVFYDVDIGQQVVDVKVVDRKSGSKVLVRGKEFRL